MSENEIGKIIVNTAIQIHKELGPGLLETVYEVILANELKKHGLEVQRQVNIPIEYHGMKFDGGFRVDIIVDNKVVIELKSVESVSKAHKKTSINLFAFKRLQAGSFIEFWSSINERWNHQNY